MKPRFTLLAGLGGAALSDVVTSVAVGIHPGRSSPTCTLPHHCRQAITGTQRCWGEMGRVPGFTPTPARTSAYYTTADGSEQPASCPASITLEPNIHPREPASLLETIRSLRMEIASAGTNAISFDDGLDSSLGGLRASITIATGSASSAVAVIQASVSSALSAAEASAARVVSAARQSAADGVSQSRTEDDRVGIRIPTSIFAITIIFSSLASSLLSLLVVYLFICRRKAIRRPQVKEGANTTLNRATVSCTAKERPNADKPPRQEAPQQPANTATAGTDARVNSAVIEQSFISHQSHAELPDISTASSDFTESSGKVYADILTTPLERARGPPSQLTEFIPAARRDDVGWPLTKQSRL